MRRALDEMEVTGIQTTLPFDRALVRDPAFIDGDDLSIGWVDDRWDGTAARHDARALAARLAANAATSTSVQTAGPSLRKDSGASRWRTVGRERAVDRWPRRR
jgi:acetyl/propionyl-CoA carboxylase alpha subunit